MTVFIEDTIIENFLVTYLILHIVFSFVLEEKSMLRIVFASIFASMVALLYPIINLSGTLLLILKLFTGYIITLIAYKTVLLKNQIFFFVMFMFTTAVYGGINLMIYYCLYGDFASSQKLPTVLIVCVFCVVSYFLNQCKIKLYSKKQINNFLFDVTITNNNWVLKTKAYLDTGNVLKDNKTQKPITLINFKVFEELNPDFTIDKLITKNLSGLQNGRYITVKTATSTNTLLVFDADKLEIKDINQSKIITSPSFALSKVKITGLNCDVILNSKLIGE